MQRPQEFISATRAIDTSRARARVLGRLLSRGELSLATLRQRDHVRANRGRRAKFIIFLFLLFASFHFAAPATSSISIDNLYPLLVHRFDRLDINEQRSNSEELQRILADPPPGLEDQLETLGPFCSMRISICSHECIGNICVSLSKVFLSIRLANRKHFHTVFAPIRQNHDIDPNNVGFSGEKRPKNSISMNLLTGINQNVRICRIRKHLLTRWRLLVNDFSQKLRANIITAFRRLSKIPMEKKKSSATRENINVTDSVYR